MAISKRIELQKQDNLMSPTVDVTSYRRSKIENESGGGVGQLRGLEEIKEEGNEAESKTMGEVRLEDNGRVRRRKIFH